MDDGEVREFEFWHERARGAIWAIALVDGTVVGTCGPLTRSEIDPDFLPTFDYASSRAAWIDGHREAFALYDPTAGVDNDVSSVQAKGRP